MGDYKSDHIKSRVGKREGYVKLKLNPIKSANIIPREAHVETSRWENMLILSQREAYPTYRKKI